MYLEHKHLKFSYPKLLCGVVGSSWVLLGTLVGFWESLTHFDKIPESRLLFGPVGPANLSFSVRSVHRGDTLVRSARSVAYISEFGRSGPTVVEIRSGGPTGPVPPLTPPDGKFIPRNAKNVASRYCVVPGVYGLPMYNASSDFCAI